jgi:hypothetical protein
MTPLTSFLNYINQNNLILSDEIKQYLIYHTVIECQKYYNSGKYLYQDFEAVDIILGEQLEHWDDVNLLKEFIDNGQRITLRNKMYIPPEVKEFSSKHSYETTTSYQLGVILYMILYLSNPFKGPV